MAFNTNERIEEFHNSDQLGEVGMDGAMQEVLGRIAKLDATDLESVVFIAKVKSNLMPEGDTRSIVVGMAGKATGIEKCLETGLVRYMELSKKAKTSPDS